MIRIFKGKKKRERAVVVVRVFLITQDPEKKSAGERENSRSLATFSLR